VKVNRLEKTIRDHVATEKVLNGKIETADREIGRLEKSNGQHKAKIVLLKGEIRGYKKDLGTLRTKMGIAKANLRTAKTDLETAESQRDQAQEGERFANTQYANSTVSGDGSKLNVADLTPGAWVKTDEEGKLVVGEQCIWDNLGPNGHGFTKAQVNDFVNGEHDNLSNNLFEHTNASWYTSWADVKKEAQEKVTSACQNHDDIVIQRNERVYPKYDGKTPINISRHSPLFHKGVFSEQCKHTWAGTPDQTTSEAQIQCALKQLGATSRDHVEVNDLSWYQWLSNLDNVDNRLIDLTRKQ